MNGIENTLMDSNLIVSGISGIVGVVGTLLLFIFHIGKYKEKIDKISTDHQSLTKKIEIAEKNIASIQQWCAQADPKGGNLVVHSASPLTLTLYAQQLLEEIKFQNFFETIKNELVKKLDNLNLKTRYDVQEQSQKIMEQLRNDDTFIPLKTVTYDKGKNYDHILLAASIILRDHYLSIHPEIID